MKKYEQIFLKKPLTEEGQKQLQQDIQTKGLEGYRLINSHIIDKNAYSSKLSDVPYLMVIMEKELIRNNISSAGFKIGDS